MKIIKIIHDGKIVPFQGNSDLYRDISLVNDSHINISYMNSDYKVQIKPRKEFTFITNENQHLYPEYLI